MKCVVVQLNGLLSTMKICELSLSPPGGLVSPSGGFLSLLCDQGLHFALIKLCLALSHQGAIIKIPVVGCHYLLCSSAQLAEKIYYAKSADDRNLRQSYLSITVCFKVNFLAVSNRQLYVNSMDHGCIIS